MSENRQKGIISWFAHNNVAANLLMIALVIGGIISAFLINKELFPGFNLNQVHVTIAYPGAAPEEIEQGISIKVEEAIKDIDGIKRITTRSSEGMSMTIIEVVSDYDPKTVLDEAKIRIDGIATFPDNSEKPNIYQVKPESPVLWVSIYGDLDRTQAKELAKDIRDELTQLPGLTKAKLVGTRAYQMAIEVSEDKLKEYQLTFDQIANAVRNSSLDLPGGSIKAENGDILLRTKAQAYVGSDFEQLVIKTTPEGSRIYLSDVATVIDGFEERLSYLRFNGKPATMINVTSTKDQNALKISQEITKYLDEKRKTLPAGVYVDTWGDATHYLDGRLSLMLNNMLVGILLVFIILALFLHIKLAFWVMVGIPVCFLGALFVMPLDGVGLTINMLTLFAFILVLGIVVDDAIVIGESAYSSIEKNGHSIDAVIKGTNKVAMTATFGVLTTVAAFVPMLLVPGITAELWKSIGLVVVLCLLFSLVESKWILPAHLAHMRVSNKPSSNPFVIAKANFNAKVNHFIDTKYRNFIGMCLRNKFSVLSTFIGVMVLAIALVVSGHVRFLFNPEFPQDFLQVNLEMEEGTSDQVTKEALLKIEQALLVTDEKLSKGEAQPVIKHYFVALNSATSAVIVAELSKAEDRLATSDVITNEWRDAIPKIAQVKKLQFPSTNNGGFADISLRLASDNLEQLAMARQDLREALNSYEGVYDINDDFSSGSQEIKVDLKPEGEALGLTMNDLAQQVRWGFYGFEAQRILRNKEEIKVLVRYPKEQRQTIGHLENMRIRTKNGGIVPFNQVATYKLDKSYATITRVDGERALKIDANVDKALVDPSTISRNIMQTDLPKILAKYPQVKSDLDGASADEVDSLKSLAMGAFFSLLVIYALMAVPLKSYGQPLIIMSVIPFGLIGAVVGHLIVGISLNVLSLMGIVALAGVVVNDSLILVDFVNKARAQGLSIKEAAIEAGCQRFRAILLTSLTTFFGLVPVILETSLQAQAVIPMATSLGFGIVFATVVTLILVPVLYAILADFLRGYRKLINWWWQPQS
ncbi:efflux RND transporter permease subunit [Paraferrimonas sp. SM1919]|uniref:efflux RND transporter permease subunit n=1 Tax=Paraferrimonas sp. SM1919 TaxID=2662263 RepID=UPI0013D4D237|nr:efflux RND transporter permease subunit [Paraferrimonas sp. SM1919]